MCGVWAAFSLQESDFLKINSSTSAASGLFLNQPLIISQNSLGNLVVLVSVNSAWPHLMYVIKGLLLFNWEPWGLCLLIFRHVFWPH